MNPMPLWIDADPSGLVWTGLDCDDDLAILLALALHKRNIIKIQGLSICGGNAPLSHTWLDINSLWTHAAGSTITNGKIIPLKGYGWRSMQVAVSLLRCLGILLQDAKDSEDASRALAKRSQNAKSLGKMNILTLGPVTNLARALKYREFDIDGISHIYMMGGELTGLAPLDLNFRSDRGGARQVIESDIPKTIISIQTCAQAIVTEEHLQQHLQCSSSELEPAACALLPKMKQQVKLMPRYVNQAVKDRFPSSGRWTPSPNIYRGFIPWDIVALLSVIYPDEFSEWEYHRVSIPTCEVGEPCDERMYIVEDLGDTFDGRNWSGIVRTPHSIRNETRLLEIMFGLLGEVPAATPRPALFWGFYGSLMWVAFATIIFMAYLFR